MQKLILSLLFLYTFSIGYSQNLVQNGDFEELNDAPCGVTQTAADFIYSMVYWTTGNSGTPDIFLSSIEQDCWNFQPNSTFTGIPGVKGSQDPHSDENFVGIFAFTISGFDQRDYIQSELSSPMIEGNEYIIEFYVSLADSTEYSIDNVGAYLSVNPVFTSSDGPLDYEPQVQFDSFIDDTENWVRIADTIVAGGNYENITIGNFNDDENTVTQVNPIAGNCIGCYGAYYFIDDVSITAYIPTGINEKTKSNLISFYPNPIKGVLNIESDQELIDANIRIMDASGKTIELLFLENGKKHQINLSFLSKGIYFIELKHKNGNQTSRLIKVED